jgi:DNA-binding MarR family transcriptional regulator
MKKSKQKRAEFIRAVLRHGNQANITQIRTELGWSRNKMNYWFPTLEEENLINIGYDDEGRRVASLTQEAKTRIQKGDFGKEVHDEEQQERTEITLSKTELRSLKEQVNQVKNQNQALRQRMREIVDRQEHLLEQVAVLRMYVETFRRLENSPNIQNTMESVEEEALEGNLDASLQKYAKSINQE